jgi:hypothetical protein
MLGLDFTVYRIYQDNFQMPWRSLKSRLWYREVLFNCHLLHVLLLSAGARGCFPWIDCTPTPTPLRITFNMQSPLNFVALDYAHPPPPPPNWNPEISTVSIFPPSSIFSLFLWHYPEATKRLYTMLCSFFVLSLIFPNRWTLTLVGMAAVSIFNYAMITSSLLTALFIGFGIGIKLFIIDNVYRKYPKVTLRYSIYM